MKRNGIAFVPITVTSTECYRKDTGPAFWQAYTFGLGSTNSGWEYEYIPCLLTFMISTRTSFMRMHSDGAVDFAWNADRRYEVVRDCLYYTGGRNCLDPAYVIVGDPATPGYFPRTSANRPASWVATYSLTNYGTQRPVAIITVPIYALADRIVQEVSGSAISSIVAIRAWGLDGVYIGDYATPWDAGTPVGLNSAAGTGALYSTGSLSLHRMSSFDGITWHDVAGGAVPDFLGLRPIRLW